MYDGLLKILTGIRLDFFQGKLKKINLMSKHLEFLQT